ncbi:hypothetical protein, partial [Salinispira pacifica]
PAEPAPQPTEQLETAAAAPAPPPLSSKELIELAAQHNRPGLLPVRKNGTPTGVAADVNGDGLSDVVLLEVAAAAPAEAEFSLLSRLSRLFTQAKPTSYFLEVFLQRGGEVHFAQSIALGRKAVLEGLKALPLRTKQIEGPPVPPVAIVASFQGREGGEQEWTVFSADGRHSRLSLANTPTMHSVVRDIDGDGLLDVMVFHTGVEAGIGYETLVTWYRYQNGAYEDHGSTNIVRNLRRFLDTARKLLAESNWRGFLDHAVAPERLAELLKRYGSTDSTVGALFTPVTDTQTGRTTPAFDYFEPGRTIENVVFPDILENPFPDPDRSSSFSMTVRIVCCDGESHFYSATVSLMPNPFGSREFSFTAD